MTVATPAATQAPRLLADLPSLPEDVRSWRILLLVSAANSLTQRVQTYLSDLGCEKVSTELALTDDLMISAVLSHSPHVVICPFLTKKVPSVIYDNVLTLIVHPGPPGDAGPAAIDWAVMGDLGFDSDATTALKALQAPVDRATPISQRQRSHWGVTVLQADDTMDGGPVWAFDQFPLPDVARITKSTVYQGGVTNATVRSLHVALTRISDAYAKLTDPTHRAQRASVRVDPKWAAQCVSLGTPFQGGPLNERPQIKPGQRRPDLKRHTAADVARLINCGDSQPGGTLKTTKSFMFAYDAHIHLRAAQVPAELVTAAGYNSFDDIPAGNAIATRDGAVLFKSPACGHGPECSYGCGVAVWLTHGRLPKAQPSDPLSAKIPMAEALRAAGEGARLDSVPEWALTDFAEEQGTWKGVFVRSINEGGNIIQLVYWDFYNGAFSTTGCERVVEALQWATAPERGNVKVLALMGGGYFSNGVALNIIESAEHPGRETWANINAIDDIVEYLAGDVTSAPRSDFLSGFPSLTERGIATVACVRGNAAAGGVALAAACDVVASAGTVVFNPSYRAMGLHGSEFHLYSYVKRCGRSVATHMAKDMLPLSAMRARELGLVDVVVSGRDQPAAESEASMIEFLRSFASAPAKAFGTAQFPAAPWTDAVAGMPATQARTLVERLTENKRYRYESQDHIPLINYRHEELSQMLLDSFHPIRSQRYHSRRIKFVRKVKAESTPTRFVTHRIHLNPDEEETPAFDDAPGWVRGEEWSWVGLQTPESMKTSEGLRIDFAAPVPPLARRSPMTRSDSSSGSEASNDIRTDRGSSHASPAIAYQDSVPTPGTVPSSRTKVSPAYTPSTESERAATVGRAAGQPKNIQTPEQLELLTGKPASRSATALAPPAVPKRRASAFLGKIRNAFGGANSNRSSLSDTSSASDRTSPTTPAHNLAPPSAYNPPAYKRPNVLNEGNTESPCLFNVTGGDLPEPQGRPTVVHSS